MYLMADGLARLLAPILSFTADELWRYLPGPREESVHLALFPTAAELEALVDPPLVERWNALMALRERVLAEIEPLRKNKQIGSSLQAKVVLVRARRGTCRCSSSTAAQSADAVHRLGGRAPSRAGRRRSNR